MPKLSQSPRAWGSATFAQTLKAELQGLDPGVLPLQAASQGGRIEEVSFSLLRATEAEGRIEAAVGVFFTETVGGCSCGDEPFTENRRCVIGVSIDKESAETRFRVLDE